jgi:hypothetical protein
MQERHESVVPEPTLTPDARAESPWQSPRIIDLDLQATASGTAVSLVELLTIAGAPS